MRQRFCILLVVCLSVWFGHAPLSAQVEPKSADAAPKKGDPAPDFLLTGPAGETFRLKDFAGKILILDVSATWCGPCQLAMPNNDRVFKKYRDQDVVLLGVTADDTRENYDGWLRRNGEKYAFRMTFDPKGKDEWDQSPFKTAYKVTGFPTMFVIDRDQKIVETLSGGGAGTDYRLEYALARAGAKVDLSAIPPEPKKDENGPKSVPMVGKTAAIPMAGGMAPAGKAAQPFVPTSFGSLQAGAELPAIKLEGVDRKPVMLADLYGKPMLVHFATAGGPQEFFTRLAKTYAADVVAVVVFCATERAGFEDWAKKNPNPPFRVLWDPAGKSWTDGVTNMAFGVGMYPQTIVVDKAGALVSGTIGMGEKIGVVAAAMLAKAGVKLTADDAKPVIDRLLADAGGKPASVPASTVIAPMGGMAMAKGGGSADAEKKPSLLEAGTAAPDFLAVTRDGKEVRIKDYAGKTLILDFWATWCGPCVSSFRHTEEIAARYKAEDVHVLAVCTSDGRKAFEKWVDQSGAKYPNILFACDPNDRDSKSFEKRASSSLYGVSGIPAQFVIAKDGKVVATIIGNDGDSDTRTEGGLALAGVKVADDVAAKGKAALENSAREMREEAARAAERAKNPPPPFVEDYGKLKAGSLVPDFTAEKADGGSITFAEMAKGKVVVLSIWSAGSAVPPAQIAERSNLAAAYAEQNVVFPALGAYESRENWQAYLKEHGDALKFPFYFDPAGGLDHSKPYEEMSEEEKRAFSALSRAHYEKVIPSRLSGGMITPIPTTLVIDAEGRFVGWFVGGGSPETKCALANLLLRAGVKLRPEDAPARVYTHEETAPRKR